MSWPDRFDSTDIETIALAANTPAYLYRQLRKDATVQAISERYSAEEIAELFAQIAKSKEQTFRDSARAYALIVALSYHTNSKWPGLLAEADLARYHWGARLVSIADASTVPSLVTSITVPPRMGPATVTDAATSEQNARVGPPVVLAK